MKILFTLALATIVSGCGASALEQVQRMHVAPFPSTDSAVLKAEPWPKGKEMKLALKGSDKAILSRCHGATNSTGVKRCYVFVNGKLWSRKVVYSKDAVAALRFYKDVVAGLSGATSNLVWRAGPKGQCVVTRGKHGKMTPIKPAGNKTLANIDDAGVATALEAGKLCAHAAVSSGDRMERLLYLRAEKATKKYLVFYVEWTSDPVLYKEEKLTRKAQLAQIKKRLEAMQKKIDAMAK